MSRKGDAALRIAVLAAFLVGPTDLAALQQSVGVDIRDFAFEPHEINIATGTAVRWVNHDDVPHQIAVEGGRPGSSGLIAPQGDYSFIFREAGRVTYRCGVHPTMLGIVIVDMP